MTSPDQHLRSAERIVDMLTLTTEWMISHSNWPASHADSLRQRLADGLLSRISDADEADNDGDAVMNLDTASAADDADDTASAARADAARRLLLRAALALLPEGHHPTPHAVAVRKPLHQFAVRQRYYVRCNSVART